MMPMTLDMDAVAAVQSQLELPERVVAQLPPCPGRVKPSAANQHWT